MFSDAITRWIRTLVPGAVAWLVGLFALSEELSNDLTVSLTALVFAIYYSGAAWLEKKWEWAGWLLGRPKSLTE